MNAPHLPFEPALARDLDTPIYLQLCERIKEAIAQGRLQPGDRVPAIRSLASQLNTARGTVEAAYQLLVEEGYLVTRGAAGTVVSPQLGDVRAAPVGSLPANALKRVARVASSSVDAALLPYQMGLPALDAFPRKVWTRLVAKRLRATTANGLASPDPQGFGPLRERIAGYLSVARGVACSPQQVFITAGHRATLDLILHALFVPGDAIWFENPGYFHARQTLQDAGATLIPVPVDAEGLDVAAGRARAPHARFALVTPSHQSPLGVTLTLPRRLALLQWARDADSWVIEDDYDSEYRYQGRPLPALSSLDRDERVIYTGTFSKVLFPGIRLAYVVAPAAHLARFAQSTARANAGAPELFQGAVADFMAEGHFARHLKRMRALYSARRSHTIDALRMVFGDRLKCHLQPGGLHVLLQIDGADDDVAMAARARAAGLSVTALSSWYVAPPVRSGLLVCFTNVVDPAHATSLARQLHRAVL